MCIKPIQGFLINMTEYMEMTVSESSAMKNPLLRRGQSQPEMTIPRIMTKSNEMSSYDVTVTRTSSHGFLGTPMTRAARWPWWPKRWTEPATAIADNESHFDEGREESHHSSSRVSTSSALRRFWSIKPRRIFQERAINKNGTCNVVWINNVDRNRRFMQDLFNTLVDCQWRYTLLAFSLSYLVSWFLFALLWYLIAAAHGDLRDPDDPNITRDPHPHPCIVNMRDFTGCFLYSVESQMTIGYGTSYPSKECPEAIFVLCMQSILGLIIQAFTVGMVFAKLTRPQSRSQTLLFSRNAVVCLRDHYLCLQFRVADLRKTHLVSARLRAHLLHTHLTAEGERLAMHRSELQLTVDHAHNNVFLIWPLTAVHKIDHSSPLYNDSAEDLLHSKYEILVFLEGTIESTGQVAQARSSYLPGEVLWGHRFESVIRYDRFLQCYEVDHSRLDSTTQVDAPLCSARDLDLLCEADPMQNLMNRRIAVMDRWMYEYQEDDHAQ